MRKRIFNLCVPALLAVLCMIVLLTSCGGSDSNDDGSNDGRRTDGSYQFETTVRAIGGDNSVMKLTPSQDGKQITATWAVGEEIAIVNSIFNKKYGTVTVEKVNNDGSAVVKGVVKEVIPSSTINLVYPASAVNDNGSVKNIISKQDGAIETISKSRDLAIGKGMIVLNGFNATVKDNPTMVNQNAICKFRFKNTNNGEIVSNITNLVIRDAKTDAVVTTVTPAKAATNAVYVVMEPTAVKEFKFIVYANGGNTYIGNQAGELVAGRFYDDSTPIQVKP
jgi:hypothetical protein